MARKREKRPEWERRVQDWRASGLSAKEYAAKHEIHPRTLTWWASKLKHEGVEPPKKSAVSFVEVMAMPSSTLRVRLGGAEVDVPSGVDEATLAMVVRVLRSPS